MLATDLYVHDNLSKEFPSNHQVFRALRTGSDNEIPIAFTLHQLDCRLRTYVSKLWMRNSTEVRLQIF